MTAPAKTTKPAAPSIAETLNSEIATLERQREIAGTKVLKLAAMVKQAEGEEAFISGRLTQTRHVLSLLPAKQSA